MALSVSFANPDIWWLSEAVLQFLSWHRKKPVTQDKSLRKQNSQVFAPAKFFSIYLEYLCLDSMVKEWNKWTKQEGLFDLSIYKIAQINSINNEIAQASFL